VKFYLGTNWKMHRTNTEAGHYIAEFLPLLREQDLSRHYLFVIPSFTSLQLVRNAVTEAAAPLKVGAQNVHWEDSVEATGEISVRILADIPVDLVEIGHSERRQKFGETDLEVNRKALAVLGRGLTALICIASTTFRITSTGQGAPAMIPVRRLLRSKRANSGCSSMPMNIVGTPCRAVHRSACTASSVARGSKPSEGLTMHEPWVTQARLPSTMPKQ